MIDLSSFFKFLSDELNITISDAQKEQFSLFIELYKETNKVMNLSSIDEDKEIIKLHLIDSVYPLKWCDLNSKNIVDLGSGGGFPAIPLAILLPNSKFTLIDSRAKKCHYLKMVADKLKLDNVEVQNARVEEIDDDTKSTFDIVTARALKQLNILLEFAIPYLKVGGELLAYKGMNALKELKQSKNALKVLNAELRDDFEYFLSSKEDNRHLLTIKKIKETPNKYPRLYSLISKKPL